jgi:hypothetical protein
MSEDGRRDAVVEASAAISLVRAAIRHGAAVTTRPLARLQESAHSDPSMPRFEPTPDPRGSLGPPDRHPPTAVGTATPPPPRPPAAPGAHRRHGLLRRAVDGALDLVDRLADLVRAAVTR